MGSSLQIITRDPVEIETTRLFAENNGLTLTTEATASDATEMRLGLGNEEDGILPLIAVDGPFKVDEEELPQQILSYLLGPQWIMVVAVDDDAPKEAGGVARSYSKFVADHCRGVVYDPADEAVIWPKSTPQKYRAAVTEERIDLVTLEWCVPLNNKGAEELVVSLLALLKKRCIEALPKRFGRAEPFKGKFLLGKENTFIDEWVHCATRESGEVFSWSATAPCFGGTARFSDQRKNLPDTWKPAGAVARLLVSMDFDGRMLVSDKKWCQTVVTLFQDLAVAMNAYYAAGYVRRNALAKKRIVLDHESENYQLQSQHWFMGLPPKPTWLAWFGPEYRKFLEDVAPECEEKFGGLLLKTNKKPLNLDDLQSVFPSLPGELRAVERSRDGYVQTTEILPALLIPVSDK